MHADLKKLFQGPAELLQTVQHAPPAWASIAPGRVNLMGDHTDYSGGLAMPMAVDLYTVAAAAPATGGTILQVHSATQGRPASFSCDAPAQRQYDWADYLRGVYAGYLHRGIRVPPLHIAIGGNLPLGAGLSSSASLELCFATLIEAVSGQQLPAAERAALCRQAEHEYAGVPCGILDQAAIVHARPGHALVLDCRDEGFTQVAMPDNALWAVVDSGVRHDLSDGGYAQRLQEVRAVEAVLQKPLRDGVENDLARLEDDTLRRRARHVITENHRVIAFADHLQRGGFADAGALMFESHDSLAGDFAVSCPELDQLVTLAWESGVYGARMTGGGFGGSMVCLLAPEVCAPLQALIENDYRTATGRSATLRLVHAASGPRAGPWSEL